MQPGNKSSQNKVKQMNILQLVSYWAMLVHFEVTTTRCWLHRKCLIL